jgi:gliding motility-associated protein GldC
MAKSTIQIEVELDEQKVPSNIQWRATDSTVEKPQQAKAFILSLWDGADKAALRIDLWTQKMMVDEMADFYYQTLMTMADTFERATKLTELTNEMRADAQKFYKGFQEIQMRDNKAG